MTSLRPIYHLERVITLAPPGSRLTRLARARLHEADEVSIRNRELTTSLDVFKLVTFSHRYLVLAETEHPSLVALVSRDDEHKRSAFVGAFGAHTMQSHREIVPDWIQALNASRAFEIENEAAKRGVPVPALSV